jgi:hypothetical protein
LEAEDPSPEPPLYHAMFSGRKSLQYRQMFNRTLPWVPNQQGFTPGRSIRVESRATRGVRDPPRRQVALRRVSSAHEHRAPQRPVPQIQACGNGAPCCWGASKWIDAVMGRIPGRRLNHRQADVRAVSRRCRTAAERRFHQCSRFRTRIHPGHTGRAGTARRCLRCFRTRHRRYMWYRHPPCTGTPSEDLRSSGLHSPAAACTGCEVRRRPQPCTRC